MRYSKKFLMVFAAAGVILLAGGCQKQTTLPDLSDLGTITAVSREDGSGTRAEFEALIHLSGNDNAKTASSTDEMFRMVSDTPGSIGYVAFSSMFQENGVKLLSVDGVTPASETIKNGKYPLCREYLLAYTGELNAAESDFLSYVKTAGQSIVGETCIPIAKADTFLSDQSSGNIHISGSSSMMPIVAALAEAYQTYNPHVEITVDTTDSTTGLNDVLEGTCDLAMSSRALKDYEKELLQTQVIGKDAIAVIVSEKNPLTDLSTKQIGEIYKNTYEKWSDVK